MSNLRNINYRKSLLRRLFLLLEQESNAIQTALFKDLGKSAEEAYLTEVSICLKETRYALKNINKWTRKKWVFPSLLNFPSLGHLHPEPLGKVLIIGPWNYPFMLVICPLISAIAAGNDVVIKPSEVSSNTAALLENFVKKLAAPEIEIVLGGVEATTILLQQPFQHIFYTGNGHVGKIVMKAAAEHLTPVTLELGGKSPCLVMESADIDMAARRIAWGKTVNAGQTCVAPDYVLIPESKKRQFVESFKLEVEKMYGPEASSDEYAKIINLRHYKRLVQLIDAKAVLVGGTYNEDKLHIAPTIVEATSESPVMGDEIFGPILPLITFKALSEVKAIIEKHPYPLASYIFSKDSADHWFMISEIASGGVCINDTVVHMINQEMPFGGIQASGMGRYRGKFGFDTFTHYKPVLKRFFFLDLPLRYPPFSGKLSFLKKLLSWL